MSATRVDELPTLESVMVQARDENFPVATWLLGPRLRRHVLAIYGFARLVDDIGDESDGDRLAMLDLVERELDAPRHPVMCALQQTIREANLPRDPFERLIEANRLDQVKTQYDTIEELLEYCQLSAAPVGELVLHLFNAATPERIVLSDRICAALQVIEHLQDIDEDRAMGRDYIGGVGVVQAHRHARGLLETGAPLVGTLRGRARLAVAGFLAGGRCALVGLSGRNPLFVRAYARAVAGR